ncbi:MAG: hypothetical protein MJ156_02735 [Alphaproteobacteria bacterium]|nr:hypothetical protein [Alphaproteobacteria bacterium]
MKLYQVISPLMPQDKKFKGLKKIKVNTKGFSNLKSAQGIRKSTGNSNGISDDLLDTNLLSLWFFLGMYDAVESVASRLRNETQAENKNYDFSYKTKVEREIDRLRKLKYQAKYADFCKGEKEANLQELVAEFETAKTEKQKQAQKDLGNWVENIKLKEQQEKDRLMEKEAFIQRQLHRQYCLKNMEKMSFSGLKQSDNKKHVNKVGELENRILVQEQTGIEDAKLKNLQELVADVEKQDLAKKRAKAAAFWIYERIKMQEKVDMEDEAEDEELSQRRLYHKHVFKCKKWEESCRQELERITKTQKKKNPNDFLNTLYEQTGNMRLVVNMFNQKHR